MLFSFLKWMNVKPRTLERPSPYYRLVSYVVVGYGATRHQPNCGLLGSSSGPTFTGVNTLSALAPPSEFPHRYYPLLRANTTIHGQGVPRDVPGLVRQEPHHGVGDLVRLADPPHRDEGGVAVRVAARSFCQQRSLDTAGADGIHPDVLLGVVQRRRLGHSG